MKPDDQFSERLTDWEPRLMVAAVITDPLMDAESPGKHADRGQEAFPIDAAPNIAVAPPASAQSAHRCVRCSDGEKPCVRGSPDGCGWRKKLAALIAATEAAVERLWAYPEDEWSSETRTTLRAAIYAARKE